MKNGPIDWDDLSNRLRFSLLKFLGRLITDQKCKRIIIFFRGNCKTLLKFIFFLFFSSSHLVIHSAYNCRCVVLVLNMGFISKKKINILIIDAFYKKEKHKPKQVIKTMANFNKNLNNTYHANASKQRIQRKFQFLNHHPWSVFRLFFYDELLSLNFQIVIHFHFIFFLIGVCVNGYSQNIEILER